MEKPLLPSAYRANSPKGPSCPANPLPYFWALPLLSSFPHAPRLIPSHPPRRVLVLQLPLLRALLVLRAPPLPPRPAAKRPWLKNLQIALLLNRRPKPRLQPRSRSCCIAIRGTSPFSELFRMEPKNLQSCVTHPPIAVPHALKACAVTRTVDTNSLRNMRSFATMIHPSISRMSRVGQILRTSQCLITTTLKPTTIQSLPNL